MSGLSRHHHMVFELPQGAVCESRFTFFLSCFFGTAFCPRGHLLLLNYPQWAGSILYQSVTSAAVDNLPFLSHGGLLPCSCSNTYVLLQLRVVGRSFLPGLGLCRPPVSLLTVNRGRPSF